MLRLHAMQCNAAHAALFSTSKNVTLVVGSSANFSCQTNSSSPAIRWTHRFSATGKLTTVYNGNKMQPGLTDKYVVIVSSVGVSNMIMKNVQKNDSGNISCSDVEADIQSFKLTVIGKINIL